MTFRIAETGPNDVIVVMNKRRLLKFIGWCEAHRPGADYEPSFLAGCLADLECANEGYALDATAECGACGAEHPLRDADARLDRDGEWYCKDRDGCTSRREQAEVTA